VKRIVSRILSERTSTTRVADGVLTNYIERDQRLHVGIAASCSMMIISRYLLRVIFLL
jgi:hypothetical protein